jgi:hypothetical protein
MLYEAAILVCLSVSPDTCHELNDTRGPYETKEACKARVDEMASFVTQANLFELNIRWKCASVSEKNDEPVTPDTQEKGIDSTTGTIPRVAI